MDGGYERVVPGVTRPLGIADFAGPGSDRPVARPVTLAELAELEPATLFESPVWLRAYGLENLLALPVHQQGGPQYPLLFQVRDRHLHHLGRLRWFEPACIKYLSELLIDQRPGIDFVVFEDVQVDGASARRVGGSVFRYQRNWQIALNGPDAKQQLNSGKSRSTVRRKQRALERDLGGVTIGLEEQPSRDLLATIVELNKAKINSINQKHGIDTEELDRLWAVVSEIGHVVAIRKGAQVIAGDVMCLVGRRAYYVVTGYDMSLSRYSPGLIAHSFSIEDCRKRGMLDFNMLWGDGVYKRRLGGQPQELLTLVARRSPAVRFTPAYARAVGSYHWFAFKALVRPFIRRQPAE